MQDHEFTDSRGSAWHVRDCDADAGCTVVEKFHPNQHHDPGEEAEPAQVVDVPADLCRLIGKALIERAERMEAEEKADG